MMQFSPKSGIPTVSNAPLCKVNLTLTINTSKYINVLSGQVVWMHKNRMYGCMSCSRRGMDKNISSEKKSGQTKEIPVMSKM